MEQNFARVWVAVDVCTVVVVVPAARDSDLNEMQARDTFNRARIRVMVVLSSTWTSAYLLTTA